MRNEGRRPGHRPRALRSLVLAAALLIALPVAGQRGDGTTEELELTLLEAESAIGQGELQIAESHYREALLEGWYLLGLLEASEESWPAAVAAFERAAPAAAVPNRGARTALALGQLRLGQNEATIQALQLLVRQEPNDVTARRHLIRAMAMAGKSAADQELEALREIAPEAAQDVAAALRAAIEHEATDALMPVLDLGVLADRSAESRAELRRLLPATLARIYTNLGVLQESTGRSERAAAYFALAAEAGPDGADDALGNIDLRENPPSLTDAPQPYDGSVRALIERSAVAADQRNLKRALEFAQRAVAAAPSSEEVLAVHTRRALAARIPSTATRSVEPLARMHPDVAEYKYLLGMVWTQLRNPGEAAEALLAAVALDPDLEEAFVPLGLALNHERRYDDARMYLERYLEAHPEDLEAMTALAEAEERLGDTASAETRVAAVLKRDAENPSAHLVAAMLHMRGQRFAEARTALERAVAADPQLAKAHYQLSQACIRLGDRACAEKHLEIYRRANLGPEGHLIQLERKNPTNTLGKAERQD